MDMIEKFKNREVKARDIFRIMKIENNVGYNFIKKYHYLGKARFLCVHTYGLYLDTELMGVAVFAQPQGTKSIQSWTGSKETKDDSIQELHRLCMVPELNGTNATSYLLGRSMKMLKREGVKLVISLADSNRHVGSIYQVCNFKYYGLTAKAKDFYTLDGKVNARGGTKDVPGVFVNRTRKHRYAFKLDKNVEVAYEEQKLPERTQEVSYDCCNGTKVVHDNRFDKDYTCPLCTGQVKEIKDGKIVLPPDPFEEW